MKLTDEMYELAASNKIIFTVIDDDYCLVTKRMPVTDEKLDDYVLKIKKAKEMGINIASILDYRFIPGTTSSFSNGTINYTIGVFLEDRAHGDFLNKSIINLSANQDYDFDVIATKYLKEMERHILELEKRAMAPQQVYDKLVSDCLRLPEYGLMIDPKPLNFFFDTKKGYTIIDVISSNGFVENLKEYEYFPSYIYSIVFGYGNPLLYIVDYTLFDSLPVEYKKRLAEAKDILNKKIQIALRRKGISEKNINQAIEKENFRVIDNFQDCPIEEMSSKIEEIYNQKCKVKNGYIQNESPVIMKKIISV